MRHRAIPALLVAALLIVAWLCLPRALPVLAQANPPAAKWQYATVVFSGGEPTFTTARQTSTIQSPAGKPAGGGNPPAFNGSDIHFASREAWSTEMLTLDALGADGWEAFSSITLSDGSRTTILLRKRLL